MALFNEDISINSILGNGSAIKGNIKVDGFIRIDGDLDGDLAATGNVILGDNARIRGNITARSITVGGMVYGNIIAPEGVHLLSKSMVLGNVQTKRLQADDDVILHGHCISLKDEKEYADSVIAWENKQAIGTVWKA
ncbi:MAG: polymer-forming cytoskeletal protein [Treponema sp.]|nr:polymer-forming cytoskeletal protein [Treponema sp.]